MFDALDTVSIGLCKGTTTAQSSLEASEHRSGWHISRHGEDRGGGWRQLLGVEWEVRPEAASGAKGLRDITICRLEK